MDFLISAASSENALGLPVISSPGSFFLFAAVFGRINSFEKSSLPESLISSSGRFLSPVLFFAWTEICTSELENFALDFTGLRGLFLDVEGLLSGFELAEPVLFEIVLPGFSELFTLDPTPKNFLMSYRNAKLTTINTIYINLHSLKHCQTNVQCHQVYYIYLSVSKSITSTCQ